MAHKHKSQNIKELTSQRYKTIRLQKACEKENNVYSGFLSQTSSTLLTVGMLITIHWPTYRDFILGRGFWSEEDRWDKSFLALTL